jgi:tRNA U34 5-methylaminomethyl-2-thiouridine-forming methyltransferase MnmC
MNPRNEIQYLNPKDIEIRLTQDGSHTLYSRHFKSTYHSLNGAIQESQFIFIERGLMYFFQALQCESIRILESGLGTGLNALLALIYSRQLKKKVVYSSIEYYPIGPELAAQLNYLEKLEAEDLKNDFLLMHQLGPGQVHEFHPHFSFQWFYDRFESRNYPVNSYDLIFFDPFDASIHPELWQQAFLERLYHSLAEKGMLITYGAKGSFKRALKALGMQVEGVPGPPGKREITRAFK